MASKQQIQNRREERKSLNNAVIRSNSNPPLQPVRGTQCEKSVSKDFFGRHKIGGATASIATFQKEVKIDPGVLEMKDGELDKYIEKPTFHSTASK